MPRSTFVFVWVLLALGSVSADDAAELPGWQTARARADDLVAHARSDDAVETLRQAAVAEEKLGHFECAARCLRDAGRVAFAADDPATAEVVWMGRLALEARRGASAARAETSRDLALADIALGRLAPALARLETALRLHCEVGTTIEQAVDLDLMADVHLAMGDPAPARLHGTRALALAETVECPTIEGRVLCRLASVHTALHDEDEALDLLDRAREIAETVGNVPLHVTALAHEGEVHLSLDDDAEARRCFEAALDLSHEQEAPDVARALLGLATVARRAGDLEASLGYQERALACCRGRDAHRQTIEALASMALTRRYLGDFEGAQALYTRAEEEARRIRARDLLVRTLWGSAEAHLCGGDGARAAAQAREAIGDLPGILGGLSEEQGAAARSRHAGVFAVGARAALALDDPALLCFFLESGRAGTLLEFLGQREALQAALVSPYLLDAEAAARSREAEALDAYRKIRDSGGRRRIRRARLALDAAREELKTVIERIQREAKAEVGALTPAPAPLERIQSWVGPAEALVLYGMTDLEAHALVVRRNATRTIDLGPVDALERACRRFLLDDSESDPGRAFARLVALVIEPLGLEADVTRVLISPDGPLAYVPFGPLLENREFACVPSGTTLGLLKAEGKVRGEGVLALGDPVYDTNEDPCVTSSVRSGVDLLPLPFTRDEALAIGDVVLLGSEATESGFRFSVAKRPRWHAVHFACHGVMDPDKPTLSALALTTEGVDDGFLTALDVFRLEIPADLVVLSACDSGVGRIVNAEGVLGLMRAFLFAGAPRVIVSLGRVDDGATRALMEAFYRRWKAGENAATALAGAQAHVRAQEAWHHPHYWANWVLWGLAD